MMHASNRPTLPGPSRLVLVAMLLAAPAVADERTNFEPMGVGLGFVAEGATRTNVRTDPGLGAGLASAVPKGTIMAFMPSMTSGDYGTASELRAWLAGQGWAICDGTGGTPDLRNRMLLGTTDASSVGQRLGSWDHTHRIRDETGIPVRRNRNTPTGRLQNMQIPDDQHRHRVDMESDKADHIPPSMRVLFIMKVR